MVNLTRARYGMKDTFGLATRGKFLNHRKKVIHHRFQDNICPEEIVAQHSRDEQQTTDKGRTFKKATETMGRRNFLLPNLSQQDLESNRLFQEELDRQRALIARIDKISVHIDSVPGRGTKLIMNKGISTPYDCTRHLHDLLTTRSVVAELRPRRSSLVLNGREDETNAESDNKTSEASKTAESRSIYWDMHRPLEEDCTMKLRHFAEDNVNELNRIYWRSCSLVLGMALKLAFKDNIKVLPHSWPKPDIRSGSFVYDAALGLTDKWQPDEQDLRAFTKVMWSIKSEALPFERLLVDDDTAKTFFAHNPFKLAQIDSIASSNGGKVTVYRCGGLLDLSVGPMISNTSQIGRITLASVHPFESNSEKFDGIFYRFQGVSLPQQLPISSFLYQNILIKQAKNLNKAAL